jgi:hypothetical protein
MDKSALDKFTLDYFTRNPLNTREALNLIANALVGIRSDMSAIREAVERGR